MNYYREAIDVITKHRDESEIILIEVAKANPGAVVKAFNTIYHEEWHKDIIPLLKVDRKIQAIKLCRELTGMGLKEAKEACEAIQL